MIGDSIDLLKIYFGDPYIISDKITLYQPSINEIVQYGEKEFFAMLYMFIGNSTYRRLFLWELGVDWNKISDYELFCNMVRMLPKEKTQIIFGDIDFETFELVPTGFIPEELPPTKEDGKKYTASEKRIKMFSDFEAAFTFVSEEEGIEINAALYHHLVDVMREMVQIYPKTEYTVGKTSKELIIEEERNKVKRAISEDDGHPSSMLLPLISACVNHPGFKYKSSELRELKIYEFMDSVKRLQIYESTRALLTGANSGFADMSKVPKEQFDFMRPIKIS